MRKIDRTKTRPTDEEMLYLYRSYRYRFNSAFYKAEGKKFPKFEEWKNDEYKDRFELVIGFNTKQPWVYDGVWDVYIDPPSEVLDRLPNWRDDDDRWYEELQAEVSKDPNWLYDRDYWYDGEIDI